MPIRGELALKGELILRELRLEAQAEELARHIAIDDDVPYPPDPSPMTSPQSRRTNGVAL